MNSISGGNSPCNIEIFTLTNNVTFGNLKTAILQFRKQAKNWTKTLNTTDLSYTITVRILNDQVMQLEKIFITEHGLPLQNQTNHVILAKKGVINNHGKASFPGIVNLLEDLIQFPSDQDRNEWPKWEDLRRHVTKIYVMIIQATSHLKPHQII